jgi:hypothetical protein
MNSVLRGGQTMSRIWDWFDEFEREAQLRGDAQRMRLGGLHREAYRFRESDPDKALVLYGEGRRLAEALHEPWWVLYYNQQCVHALLHFKQDYRNVLDQAIANVLEVRKPAYVNFARRLLIHGDLVSAYLGIDPVGHADSIRQALEYLDRETPAEGDERYLLLGGQRQFAIDLGAFDDTDRFSRRSLELAATDSDRRRTEHFLVFCYSAIAEVAWKRGDPEQLEEAILSGEELAQRVGHQVELSGFQMWRAWLLRRAGDEERACTLYRQASQRMARLGMPADAAYRDAESDFHVLAGRLGLALAVRDAELAGLRDRGRVFLESNAHLKRCDLLRRLGRLTASDLEGARQAARRLREPAGALEALARIERSTGVPPV